MDVRIINAFLNATENVLNTMAFIMPKVGKPYLKKDNIAKGDISGIIGLTGDLKGSLGLSFNESSIVKIVSNMLGEPMDGINNDVKDAVGEITNMISGVARKNLESEGFNITAAIPTVVAGKNHSIVHVLGGPSIIIPFDIDEGPFVLDVCLGNS
ncbi:MAG TPA: chemotaxis protein CheX [Chitinispirillaceae bacterium]|nr:chemotaxis protein CheX [Chitinispirillaceae bacterium]